MKSNGGECISECPVPCKGFFAGGSEKSLHHSGRIIQSVILRTSLPLKRSFEDLELKYAKNLPAEAGYTAARFEQRPYSFVRCRGKRVHRCHARRKAD